MRASGTFAVTAFTPAEIDAQPVVVTALPVGVAIITKTFEGEISGHSATVFTAAFDQNTGTGTYIAMESFEGTVAGRAGSFNFLHSATTSGTDRSSPYFMIVPNSGTGELAGITGGGELTVDADGTHRVRFDYELR